LEYPAVIERLVQAMNDHDPDAMAECFREDYRSEQPLHPDRRFTGRDQLRKNWSEIFENVPNLKAELLRYAGSGAEIWTEWLMHGTQADGSPFEYRGMAVWGLEGDIISWGRLYFELVEAGGAGIDESIKRLVDKQ
jgi:ketosteroid isomerase-like protein